jgi:hypothetical protein
MTAPLVLLSALGLTPQSPSLVGRWDLSVTDGTRKYASWFEITATGGTLAGRYQGGGGHASRVIDIEITGDRFRFLWPNDDDAKLPPTVIEGTLTGPNSLTGSTTGRTGRKATFQGVRAPLLDRPEPKGWDSAVDLVAAGMAGWVTDPPEAPNRWSIVGGELVNAQAGGNLVSRQRFQDFQLHIEVSVPPQGNSGIYLRGRHEVQVQDDYGNPPHSRRMGGIYGQVTPTSLPAKPAGEWQMFDITFVGRRVTVALNGVTIIDRQEIPGITGGALDSDEAAPGPIMLQGDHGPIKYRNIVVRPAKAQ